ncbi:MAG: PAS domain-containing protein [Phycisphaerae bacterium]|nr:PAS domain-containing protein [Saprospiraceae bacterium]
MEHLHNLFDGSPNGLLLFESASATAEWRCTFANSTARSLFGLSNPKGLLLDEIFPKHVAEKLDGPPTTTVTADAVDFFIREINRWVMASSHRTGTQMTIALTDITFLKEAATTDRNLMRLYKSLSNSLADNEIILFDKDLNILLSEGSPRFIRLGLEGNLTGKNLAALFESNPFTFLGEYVSKVFGGERAEVEREINGKFYKASVYADSRDDDESSSPIVGVLLLKDVSELNKKQRELEVRLQQLDRSNRELQEFAYVASHDLQEPLRKIMSFGQRLSRKYNEALIGEGQEYLTRMNNAARRMETLINDLLSFSRVTRSDLKFELTDLNQIFDEVIADMDAVERTKAQIELPGKFPTIEAIPSQMRQLFQNLFNNALKFVDPDRPPKVVVRCRTMAGTEFPETYALLPEKDYCTIEIEDNGIGFEQANAERIFTIFQRLHGRSEYVGTGVGLSICKKIVDNHQGTIFAQGESGKGAVFTIALPFKQGV